MPVYLTLLGGIIVVSWGSIFVRWLGNIHPLIITFYRLAISALILACYLQFTRCFPCWNRIFLRRGQASQDKRNPAPGGAAEAPPSPHPKDGNAIHQPKADPGIQVGREWIDLGLAGFFLSLHFITWIASLQRTTVSNSIFLESTHPLFGWIFSFVYLRERISFLFIPTFIVASVGMYCILAGDFRIASDALHGDLLALFSALCIAAYLIMARRMKKAMDILPYLCLVYGIAALITLSMIVFLGLNFWNMSALGWFLLFLLAIGPNLVGHSILNWASRKIPVYIVNMALLSEAVLATIYAALLLHEFPTREFYLGASLILASMLVLFLFNPLRGKA